MVSWCIEAKAAAPDPVRFEEIKAKSDLQSEDEGSGGCAQPVGNDYVEEVSFFKRIFNYRHPRT